LQAFHSLSKERGNTFITEKNRELFLLYKMKMFIKAKVLPQAKNDVIRFVIPSPGMLKYGDHITDSRIFLLPISFHSSFKLRKTGKKIQKQYFLSVFTTRHLSESNALLYLQCSLLGRIVCYFYHCPSFYFPCVTEISLPLTTGTKKLRRETAKTMKLMFSALWLPVDSGALPLLVLQLLSKLTREYIK